ncbi:CopG family transcriptional regulator [Candidatus Spongiisocius sp.]|uniref:ribbon-helix-helix domain-containing protein n=1 Tax=Candidatus Spongiisocius sp. TaxID=3101273 RepID=UPI003B5CB930
MKRIQLYMDDDLDDALSAEAFRLGTSRSALVRHAVRLALRTDSSGPGDPVDELIGWVDVEPEDDIDSVIYSLDG